MAVLNTDVVRECDPRTAMCDFLLRQLPAHIQAVVRERAEQNGHSTQAELRDILSGEAGDTWAEYFDAEERARDLE